LIPAVGLDIREQVRNAKLYEEATFFFRHRARQYWLGCFGYDDESKATA
jgi:hypothetical protein